MTLQEKSDTPGGFTTGFDYLRISLAVGVLLFHSLVTSNGGATEFWTGPWRFVVAIILPMFFALSGYLVTGSLFRVNLRHFVTLRVARIVPALAVEITLSAVLIGTLVTTVPIPDYLGSAEFYQYFLNIIGLIHFFLPGVFEGNPYPRYVNGQLWTIPYELECYLALVVLAVLGVIRRRALLAATVAVISLVFSAHVLITGDVNHLDHVAGRMLVLSFLAAVSIYTYRDVLPYSHLLGALSLAVSAALLQHAELAFFAAIPVAYATVWLGLMRPPAIPFGDLSYGVYLFHFPVQQTAMHVFPGIGSWWLLSLISLPVTTACAWLSWTFVEHPILARKKKVLAASDWLMEQARPVTRRLQRRPAQ